MLIPGLPLVLLTILSVWFGETAWGAQQSHASHYADSSHGNKLSSGGASDRQATTASRDALSLRPRVRESGVDIGESMENVGAVGGHAQINAL